MITILHKREYLRNHNNCMKKIISKYSRQNHNSKLYVLCVYVM